MTTRTLLTTLFGGALALGTASCARPAVADTNPATHEVELVVHGAYAPEAITAVAGERLRLKITRHDEGDCTKDIVFPSLGIRATLPPHQTTVVDLPALPAGTIDFECGMKMIHGKITAKAKG